MHNFERRCEEEKQKENCLNFYKNITTKIKRKELVDREDEGFSSYPEGADAAAAVGDLTLTANPVR